MFAIWNHKDAAHISRFALLNLQHRGQQGAGISVFDTETSEWSIHKKLGLVNDVFKTNMTMDLLKGNSALAGVHYSSTGYFQDTNGIDPIKYTFIDQSFSICFDGNITNAMSIRRELEKEGTIFFSHSDTELFAHLLRQSQAENMIKKIKDVCRRIEGGYSVVILAEDGIYAFVDPAGLRPLTVGQMNNHNDSYLIASESCVLDSIGAHFVYEMTAGEIIHIDQTGYTLDSHQKSTQLSMVESMEYIYFARPDSTICGVNVYKARKSLGRYLAKEDDITEGDIVMGVPNSSLIAASGYAEEKGLPYDLGLVKNQYIGRTFIEPTQELRELGVKNKLSVISESVKDKVIILIDDSIVRGTTSKQIVQLLIEAGAKEVHLRISSPPILFPNYYGIDMSTSKELIASKFSLEEMADYIGCATLKFLSIDALKEAIALHNPHMSLSLSIFNGDYHAGLGDYKQLFEEQLTSLQLSYLN